MFSLGTSVAGLYIETVLYTTASLIVLIVLITELSVLFSSATPNESERQTTITLEMSIDCSPTSSTSKKKEKAQHNKEINLNTEDSSVSPKTCSYAGLLPICVYVLYLFNLNFQFFGRFAVGINHNCDYAPIGGFFFMAAKCCLYLVLLHRLKKVYSGTMFQSRSGIKRLKIATIFTVICALFIAVTNAFTVKKVVVMIGSNRICNKMTHPLLFLLFVVYDLIINIGCCYAFSRPLLWLIQMRKKRSQTATSKTIYSTVVRYTVITFVTVSTTFLVIIVCVLLQMNDIVMVDIAINSVCVMLFNKSYITFYHCLCCGAHKMGNALIQRECCCSTRKEDEKEEQTV